MAGIGVKLNRIFEKKSVFANLIGFTYSTVATVAPMILVISAIVLMGWVLGLNRSEYLAREVFFCTVLYIFIFALLTASPFNAVLSKYMSDAIFEERYQDILPCYYLGLAFNIVFSCLFGIPFCLWEHFIGGVNVFYVFTGFSGYISLVLVFYSMIYLSVCKDYQKISVFFLIGMIVTFVLSLILHFIFHWEVMISMLFSLMVGFFLTAVMEFATIKRYFVKNSNRYKEVLKYFGKWWQLVFANFFYILGLYIHNFVFWTSDMRIVVVKSFVCNQPYDMATCIAMFTNISATVIFIARIEMHFHEKYKVYSESVIGGKKADIDNAKRRMFRSISNELMGLVRVQFIISVVVFLLCIVLLPRFGLGGMVMRIYPCMAAGYFILFLMYAAILFLYYYNDLAGAVMTTAGFCLVTFLGSVAAMQLSEIWYGLGVLLGAFTGWTIAYARLRWVEKHLDRNIFCKWQLLKRGKGKKPSDLVYRKPD
jgi:uncharacterized membrane protein